MSTTTIRLDEDLKARLSAAAERKGKTAHALILDAIAETVELAEREEQFHRLAEERWAAVMVSGENRGLGRCPAYLQAKARGQPGARPKARKLAR